MRYIIIFLIVPLMTSCASQLYKSTKQGRFQGALDVRWIENDYFLFLPNENNPFTFTRQNGQSIEPGPMYTDGGSIPRFLWGIKGYSPWGYAPAYIVHDWMFEVKRCNNSVEKKYIFQDSVNVMAESLKAVMEHNIEVRNYFVFDSIVAAIGSPIARRLWERGSCNSLKMDYKSRVFELPPGELLMTIRFD